MKKIFFLFFACVLFCSCGVLDDSYTLLQKGEFRGIKGGNTVLIDSVGVYAGDIAAHLVDFLDDKRIEGGQKVFVYQSRDGIKVTKTNIKIAADLSNKGQRTLYIFGIWILLGFSVYLLLCAVKKRHIWPCPTKHIIAFCVIVLVTLGAGAYKFTNYEFMHYKMTAATAGEVTDVNAESVVIDGTRYYVDAAKRMQMGKSYALFDVGGTLYPYEWDKMDFAVAKATVMSAYFYCNNYCLIWELILIVGGVVIFILNWKYPQKSK